MLQDNSLSFFTERLHAIFDPVNKTRFQGFNRYTGKIRRIFTPSGRKEAGVAEPARLGGRVAASSNLVIPTTEHQQIEVGEIRLFGYS